MKKIIKELEFKYMAFSNIVTLIKNVTTKYENKTKDFEVYMHDLLELIEKEVYALKKNQFDIGNKKIKE